MSQLRYDPYESPKSGGRKGRRKEDGVVLFDEVSPLLATLELTR